MSAPTERLLLLGTHDYSIHALFFDTERRTLRRVEPFPTPQNPSWLEHHPTIPDLIYANSHAECKVFPLRVDASTGKLTQLAEAGTGGQLPAHYTVHPTAGLVFSHYGSGHITSIPIDDAGLPTRSAPAEQDIFAPPQFAVDESTHERQHSPRTHQVYVLPDGDVLFPDFGSDKVWRLHHTAQGWVEREGGTIEFNKTDGPRHCLLHPDGKHLYTLTEMGNELVIHDINSHASGPIARHTILPPGDTAHPTILTASELILLPPLKSDTTSPGSMLLITTNRDSPNPEGDALTLFAVSPTDGAQVVPAPTKHVWPAGKHLRGVAADEEGRFVAVTSRNTDELVIYERTEEDGGLGLKEVAREGGMVRVIAPLWVKRAQ